MKEVFDGIYASGGWGGMSGPGSHVASLNGYKRFLTRMLTKHRPSTVLDVGCGFFEPYADVEWPAYVGIDVARDPIAANSRYASPTRRFIEQDWLDGELPAADFVLCKDVLQHWDHATIRRGLQRLSAYPLVLITNSAILAHARPNEPIETGGCAPLNLLLPPFSLRRPEDFVLFSAPANADLDLKLALLFMGTDLR